MGNLSLAEDTLLHASTLDELLAFDLGAHLHLCRGLSAGAPWTPQARIARAFRAGIAARLVLAGVTDYQQASLAVPFRNRCYIVLRCRAYPRGFYTEELATFRRHVPKDSAADWSRVVCATHLLRGRKLQLLPPARRRHGRPSCERAGGAGFGVFYDPGAATAADLLHRCVRDGGLEGDRLPDSLPAGGFMVAVPADERVGEQLQDLTDAVHDHPLLYAEAAWKWRLPVARP